ncbi:MAG: hypothetical protein JNJ45_10200 [Chthonomonas sp.]|nr:hypothetical protein [Chthonomonas sp.]
MLVGEGIVSADQIDRVLAAQRRSGARLGELLVAMGLATETQVTKCLAAQYRLPVVHLDEVHPHPDALNQIPAYNALHSLVLPVKMDNGALVCVIADPLELDTLDQLSTTLRLRIVPAMATASELHDAIAYYYGLDVPRKAVVEVQEVRRKKPEASDRDSLIAALDQSYAFLNSRGLAA